MTGEANTHIGCAAVRYTDNGWTNFLMACNYATTNLKNHRMYASGTTASGCKSGISSTYPNLCSTSENYVYP